MAISFEDYEQERKNLERDAEEAARSRDALAQLVVASRGALLAYATESPDICMDVHDLTLTLMRALGDPYTLAMVLHRDAHDYARWSLTRQKPEVIVTLIEKLDAVFSVCAMLGPRSMEMAGVRNLDKEKALLQCVDEMNNLYNTVMPALGGAADRARFSAEQLNALNRVVIRMPTRFTKNHPWWVRMAQDILLRSDK